MLKWLCYLLATVSSIMNTCQSSTSSSHHWSPPFSPQHVVVLFSPDLHQSPQLADPNHHYNGDGFLASPGYPTGNYLHRRRSDMLTSSPPHDVSYCMWHLIGQPTQTIRITLVDFELDVRRQGQCHDRLSVLGRHQSRRRLMFVLVGGGI